MSSSSKNNKKTKRRRKGFPIWATILIFVLAALLLFAGGVAVYWTWFHRPALSSHAPIAEVWKQENFSKSYHWSSVFAPGRKHTGADAQTVLNNPAKDSPSTSVIKPIVNVPTRDERSVNFLLMGHDKVALNTDVIMLVNFDMDEGSLDILQIPRDTFYQGGRVNTLMATERSKARSANPSLGNSALLKKGMEGAVNNLEKSLGIVIDGYAIIDLQGFREVIDILGGVYMDVPYAMHYDDPEQGLSIHLDPGPQTLNGAQAEMFVRYRKGYLQGDIGRVNAQKIFLTALFAELKEVPVSKIPALAEAAITHVTTDLGLSDIVYYAKEFLGVDMSKVSMMTLPGYHTVSAGGGSYYVMNRAATLPLINEYFNVFDYYDITEQTFDTERDFTASQKNFSAIYDSKDIEAVVENAESISNGDMNAPPA